MKQHSTFRFNVWRTIITVLALAACGLTARADDANRDASFAAQKQALSALQPFIGQWRGVGQPRRGSNQGAWTAESSWAWQFSADGPRLIGTLKDAKWYSSLAVSSAADGKNTADRKRFTVSGRRTDGKDDHFAGELDDEGNLVLVRHRENADQKPKSEPKQEDQESTNRPARITIRLLAENNRMVVLYERESGKDDARGARYARLAEVGSTRRGSDFAKGSGGPECIVTGGLGTIEVQHQGRTYFVCCTGCRDAFNDDPEAVLAEYRERKAANKKKKAD